MEYRGFFGEGPIIAPPRDDAPARPVTGFVLAPMLWQTPSGGDHDFHAIYRLAYEWARAALQPSWYEYLCRASRN
jgi:hypothetical protein